MRAARYRVLTRRPTASTGYRRTRRILPDVCVSLRCDSGCSKQTRSTPGCADQGHSITTLDKSSSSRCLPTRLRPDCVRPFTSTFLVADRVHMCAHDHLPWRWTDSGWLVVGECREIGLFVVPAHSGYGVFPSTFHFSEGVCVRIVVTILPMF
jgi:hypothetical protein